MQVFIKTLTGKSITLDVSDTDTMLSVKKKIHEKDGIAVEKQRLVFAGKELTDEDTFLSAGIQKDSTIHLICRLR